MKSALNLESKKKINKTLNNTMRKRKRKKEKIIAKRYGGKNRKKKKTNGRTSKEGVWPWRWGLMLCEYIFPWYIC